MMNHTGLGAAREWECDDYAGCVPGWDPFGDAVIPLDIDMPAPPPINTPLPTSIPCVWPSPGATCPPPVASPRYRYHAARALVPAMRHFVAPRIPCAWPPI